MANNRILFATVQLRTVVPEKVLSCDSGASTNELPVVSAQMDSMCARKGDYRSDTDHYKMFFDELASGIIEYKSRLVGAEMDAAFWSFIPEMRARGVQVDLAAWSPCMLGGEPAAKSDSVGIFIIGPCEAIRLGIEIMNEEDQQTRGSAASEVTGRLIDTHATQRPADLSNDSGNNSGNESKSWFCLATFTQIILNRTYICDCHGEIWPRKAHTPLIVCLGGVGRMGSLQKEKKIMQR